MLKRLFQIDDGWGQLLAKYGNVVPEWTKLVVERSSPAGPVPWAFAAIVALLPTALTPNTSAKVVKAKAAAPVA
nr:hypothetical protein [Serratia fonticola]